MRELRGRRWTRYALAMALLACAHAKTTDAQRQDQAAPESESAMPRAKTESGSNKTRVPLSDKEPKSIPVVAHAEGLLKPGAEQRIRDKLSEGGWLAERKASTDAALRRFQDSHDLPATGMPDHQTIRMLGLNPDEVFRKAAP